MSWAWLTIWGLPLRQVSWRTTTVSSAAAAGRTVSRRSITTTGSAVRFSRDSSPTSRSGRESHGSESLGSDRPRHRRKQRYRARMRRGFRRGRRAPRDLLAQSRQPCRGRAHAEGQSAGTRRLRRRSRRSCVGAAAGRRRRGAPRPDRRARQLRRGGEALSAGRARYAGVAQSHGLQVLHLCARDAGGAAGQGGKVANPSHLPGGSANAALMLVSVGLASAYGRQGIRVNAINPGVTLSERAKAGHAAEGKTLGISEEEARRQGEQKIPLGRYARPEEIAAVAVFLASDRASYVTGAVISMDGAATATIV